MSGIIFALTVLFAAYFADLLASHWGFPGTGLERMSADVPVRAKRRMSSKPKGQPSSQGSPLLVRYRRTGMRVP